MIFYLVVPLTAKLLRNLQVLPLDETLDYAFSCKWVFLQYHFVLLNESIRLKIKKR